MDNANDLCLGFTEHADEEGDPWRHLLHLGCALPQKVFAKVVCHA